MKNNSRKSKQNPSQQRPKYAQESFSGGIMTSFGGAGLWRRFLDKLKMPQRLCQIQFQWAGRKFSAASYLMALLVGQLLGSQRQSEVTQLRDDPGALLALGLETVPSQSALSRFLASCDEALAEQLLALNRQLVQKLRCKLGSATIDLDGQIVSTRGEPEGANFGYNPKRRGCKSYFVLMGFLGEVRDVLTAHLYPGSEQTVSAEMAIAAYQQSRRALGPRTKRLRLRADSAFFSDAFFCELEQDKVSYFVVAVMSPPLKCQIAGLEYRELDDKWAIGELQYQARSWKRPRRMVVIRKRLEPDHKQARQPTLFECDRYAYQVIVTNTDWKPQAVWHFYNHRCCCENMIKEGQSDFGTDHILSHTYGGNATWLGLAVLAYNIANWFRDKILGQKEHRKMTKWLWFDKLTTLSNAEGRRTLINIPARLVHSGRRYFLRMWSKHPSRELYEGALRAVGDFSL